MADEWNQADMPSTFTYPRLVDQLLAFLPFTARVQVAVAAQDASGQPVLTYTDVGGLEAIPCSVAPASSDTTILAAEHRTPTMTRAEVRHYVHLGSYYPQIAPRMRLVLAETGEAHEILGVDHDPQLQFTRLRTEVVTV